MLNLSPKQKEYLKNSNARLNIMVGSVRSGKTYVSILRWLEYIQEAPQGNLVIVGRTAASIKRNIIDEIFNLIGNDAQYSLHKGEMIIWTKKIYVIAGYDFRSEFRLRGSTFAGALCDELTLLPESFFKMLLSRLSVPNAKLFGSTNPDSPSHYIKKDFIDDPCLDLKCFNFTLEDNPSLTIEYKENLKKEYKGLWYKRFIEGKWVAAEGAIFDFFDKKLHLIEPRYNMGSRYLIGIDYGTTNPCAFVLVGINSSLYPQMWVEKEYYWDSRKENRQKSDSEYAEDLKRFCESVMLPIDAIYVDPSAASFKIELYRNGFSNVSDANNDVLNGIRLMSNFLSSGILKICSNCINLIEEIEGYKWDEKSQKLGIDKPLKEKDHGIDSLKYAIQSAFPDGELGSNLKLETTESLKSRWRRFD